MIVSQVYKKDLAFWRPTTKRPYDNSLWASVTQIDGKTKVSIPATSRAIQRTNGYAAYLRKPLSFVASGTELIQGYPDSDGNVSARIATIPDAGVVGATLDVGDYLLVDGSENGGPTDPILVTQNPTTFPSQAPNIGAFGEAVMGRTVSGTQNMWLVGGDSALDDFIPKNGIDFVTITENPDTSLTINSIRGYIGFDKLFPTCCVIQAERYLDRLLYTGGMDDWVSMTTVTGILDKDGTYSLIGLCPEPMVKSSAISIPVSGTILVSGGLDNTLNDSKGTAFFFNPFDESWSPTFSNLRTARRDHKSIILDGGVGGTSSSHKWILIVGGKSGVFSNPGQKGPDVYPLGVPTNKCEIIDVYATTPGEISTAPFVSVGNMSDARYSFGMTKLPDGRVLVCGGIGYNPDYPPADPSVPEYSYELNRCEIFDPVTCFWTPIQSMLEPHSYCVCSYVPQTNKVYVYGGYTSTIIEYLDLNDMTWHKSNYYMPTSVVFGSPINASFGFLGLIGGGAYNINTSVYTPNVFTPPPPM